MATAGGRNTSTSKKRSGKSNTNHKSSNNSRTRGKSDAYQAAQDGALFHEIGLIVLFVVMLFFFCCNFGLIGPVGKEISQFMFGVFGWPAYVIPILLFVGITFWFANEGNPTALRKLISAAVLTLMLGVICELLSGQAVSLPMYDAKEIYDYCSVNKVGGGIIAG